MVLWWLKGEFLVACWCSRCHRGHTHMTRRHSTMGARHLLSQNFRSENVFLIFFFFFCDKDPDVWPLCFSFNHNRPLKTIRDYQRQVPDALCGEAEGNALRAISLRNTNRSHQTLFQHKTHLEPSWKLKTSKKKKKKSRTPSITWRPIQWNA